MKTFLEFHDEKQIIDMERIDRLYQKMKHRKASICSERALLFTTSWKQSECEDFVIRKAKAFAHVLDNMSIYIEDDSLIFGNQASRNFAAPIFPEYSYQWIIDELDEFEQRKGDVFYISEDVKADLRSIADYWLAQTTHQDEVFRNTPETIVLAEKQGALHRGGISMSGDGHIVPDHALILEKGFGGLLAEIKQKLVSANDEEAITFYQAATISLEASLRFIARYQALLEKLVQNEKDEKRKHDLKRMERIASSLLKGKTEHFYDGVQAVDLIHVLHMIESNGHSFCYGRFDQYMLELYERDIASGYMSKEEALEIITHMFLMNSSNNKVRPYGHTKFSQGYPLYSNLMIGGYKPNGEDGTNALSYLCIEAMNLTSMAEPNFSMRYNQDTPEDLLRLAVKLIRTGCGMPSLFNDRVAVKGLVDLGVSKEDALDYCAIGCVETGVPGKYGHRATGMTYVNWGKLLEFVLNNGVDPNSGIQLMNINGHDGSDIAYNSYEELWDGWKKVLTYYSDLAVACDAICDRSLEKYDASPFASCFIDNCLAIGKTLKRGGCKYDIISQSNIGPSVVGNSLAAIKKLVFEEQVFSLEEMLRAMKHNWEGEDNRQIHKQLLRVPKFGNDIDYVDRIVKCVFDSYLELLPSYQTQRTGKGPLISCYTMSTSNITSYVPNGLDVGATPDGRIARSPLNEGCSPTQGTDINGPTAVINSVAKLPNDKVAAGQLLNMRFSPSALTGDDNLQKFICFLRVSEKKGIYHNQFNIVDAKTLKEAMKKPEDYADVIVRVAGYCAQFISLMPEAQEAIIARSENTWQ